MLLCILVGLSEGPLPYLYRIRTFPPKRTGVKKKTRDSSKHACIYRLHTKYIHGHNTACGPSLALPLVPFPLLPQLAHDAFGQAPALLHDGIKGRLDANANVNAGGGRGRRLQQAVQRDLPGL